MNTMTLANRIARNSRVLSNNEQKIADYFLHNTASVTTASISTLSQEIGTSNAAISRFCHKLEYRSFAELKTMLLQETAVDTAILGSNQIVSYYNQILQSSAALLESKALIEFIDYIKSVQRILVCGIGSSGLSAIEFKNHLSRMGISIDAETDPHQMVMRASLLTKNDLLVVISNSGTTEAIIRASEFAKANQATIFALTIKDYTALTNSCDGVLFTSSIVPIADERFINSQLSIHFIFDVIYYRLLEDETFKANRDLTLATLKK